MQWPGPPAFHSYWPLLANDLIVGGWKFEATASDSGVLETDYALLDPPAPKPADWRSTYALELGRAPGIMQDLNNEGGAPGDGVERVLERGQLSSGERAVMRAWLSGDDLARIAEDLAWRPQTVGILYRNALDRLRWMGDNPGLGGPRGNVRGSKLAGRARASLLPRAASAGLRAGGGGAGGGLTPGRVRGVRPAAAAG